VVVYVIVFTSMRYLSFSELEEIKECVVGRLAIFIEHVDVLRLDELTYIHPAVLGGIALYSDLERQILLVYHS
jgi:hypothetical protein